MEFDFKDHFAGPTTDEIVGDVARKFAARLEEIIKPAFGFHDFQTQSKSGISICVRCGLPNTKKNQVKKCDVQI